MAATAAHTSMIGPRRVEVASSPRHGHDDSAHLLHGRTVLCAGRQLAAPWPQRQHNSCMATTAARTSSTVGPLHGRDGVRNAAAIGMGRAAPPLCSSRSPEEVPYRHRRRWRQRAQAAIKPAFSHLTS